MRGRVLLSRKESERAWIMQRVVAGELTVRQGARLLGLSERHVKRLKGGMKRDGVAYLCHKNRGRKPKHAVSEETRQLVVTLATGELRDTNCTHLSELLEEHRGIRLSARTVRRILTQAGIPRKHAKKPARRRRSRKRMPRAGMLVQCDSSPFEWVDGTGRTITLHGLIDDATGAVLGLRFEETERLWGYVAVLRQMVSTYGVPERIYSDRHTIFFSQKRDKLTIEEELSGKKVSLTQLGRMLEELSTAHVPAHSPQAKGRVERLWGTLQDRLVVEMRLAGVSSIEEANAFLERFMPRFNDRFAVLPREPEHAFRPAPSPEVLERVLCIKEQRKASNGSTISYGGRTYRLVNERGRAVPLAPRSTVTVLTHHDGSYTALCDDKEHRLELFSPPPKATPKTVSTTHHKSKPPKPAADHPWKRQAIHPGPKRDPVAAYFDQKDRSWEKLFLET